MLYYLLLKSHNQTRLKYLCRHHGTKQSCFDYPGSGTYWKRHLRKHGKDISTKILFETADLKELSERGVYYSKLWDVVKSKKWANLCPESGEGGLTRVGFKLSKETKRKISLANKGRPSACKGIPLTEEHKLKLSKAHTGLHAGPKNPMFGKTHDAATRQRMGLPSKGRSLSEEVKRKMSVTLTGQRRSFKTKQNISKALKGRRLTEEWKKKISLTKTGKPVFSLCGPKHPNWKGGCSYYYRQKHQLN